MNFEDFPSESEEERLNRVGRRPAPRDTDAPRGSTSPPDSSPDDIDIVETLLSRKPRPSSLPVAILSVMLMLFFSLLHWRSMPGSIGLGATPETIWRGQYWRLLTSIAVHSDLGHLAANGGLFLLFSYLLYGYFGFWIYPVLSLLAGGLTSFFSLMTYPPNTLLLGSSGVVYLMAGFWLTLYALIERRLSARQRLLRIAGVGLLVLVPSSIQEHVSYRTHAIGCAMGVVLAAVYFMARRKTIRSAEAFAGEVEGKSRLAPPRQGSGLV
jgi:rhomboid protease GluP